MNINLSQFSAALADPSQPDAGPAVEPQGFGMQPATAPATPPAARAEGAAAPCPSPPPAPLAEPVDDPATAQPAEVDAVVQEAAPIGMFSRPAALQPPDAEAATPLAPGAGTPGGSNAHHEKLKTMFSRWIDRQRASRLRPPKAATQAAGVPQPSARKPNRQRLTVIAAGLFALGIIVGPWLVQQTAPPAPAANGPNPATQAIAATLESNALGVPVPGVAPQRGEVAVEAEPPKPAMESPAPVEQAPIPAAGEERYTAMLQRLKGGGRGDHASEQSARPEPPRVVAAINPAVLPRPAANADEGRDYPQKPVPLQIEQAGRGSVASRPESRDMQVRPGIAPAGRYQVVAIQPDARGQRAALMMPVGGRVEFDAAWVRAGDATSDGYSVESVSATVVTLRSPVGRFVELVP